MNPFIAEIIMFGGNFAPRGWAFCNGQLLAIAEHTALFSLLGTTYGGDGRTTFALPDIRGRLAIHPGRGPGLTPYSLGERGGTEYVVLISTQLPSHTHNVNANSAAGTEQNPGGHFPAASQAVGGRGGGTEDTPYSASINSTMNPLGSSNSGSTQMHTNMMPTQCVSYIIALEGTFPSRS